ncbi:DUF2971 domain-containing protein [Marinimicrobium alkaliphilum]|uniref:DUF2971 domain-containing protein n=1 Tax=Marinimicrobium alkaliphilum TaxID=2202654 RepID=UPI000DB94A50|nr:DUF2971 domain-containing protein [Marinimicrobium alkaliphilum]
MADHPDTLSKYCTADTALKILQSQRLRWSAPHLLGDPFELHHRTTLTFDPHSLLDAAIQTATAMIFSRDAPVGNSPLTTVVRRWRDEDRFSSQEEAEEVLRDLMARMVDKRQEAIDEMMADWRRFTRHLRIVSFSAKPDNLACWQRFADSHRGAVIRMHCGGYTNLKEPHAVEYRANRPEISSLKEQLNAVLHNEQPKVQHSFGDKFLVKPQLASTEQEWRCFHNAEHEASSRENDDSLWYDDRPFERADISAVYFGAFMPSEDKRKLWDLLKEQYADARVFQAEPAPGKYEVAFKRITRQG